MNEETAIFVEGKRLSALRNSGRDLSKERIEVGNSRVLPDELADEYDKHYPPGPHRVEQVTQKVFHYEINTEQVRDYRGELLGLMIYQDDEHFNFLSDFEVFRLGKLEVTPSICNQFDLIEGGDWTFVIDKLNLKVSVVLAKFASDSIHWIEEKPILGLVNQSIDLVGKSLPIHVRFPFVAFDKFSSLWDWYTQNRITQVKEMQRANWEQMELS